MPAGRPTELTPEVLAAFVQALPVALYLETVADYVGIHRSTVHRWIKRGAKEARRLARKGAKPDDAEGIYVEFCNAIKKAIAQGAFRDAESIQKASESQWQAAAWRLERRFPLLWGNNAREVRELKQKLEELETKVDARQPTSPAGKRARG